MQNIRRSLTGINEILKNVHIKNAGRQDAGVHHGRRFPYQVMCVDIHRGYVSEDTSTDIYY